MMYRVRHISEFDLSSESFILGATKLWYLFILATDNGTPQRQCKCELFDNLLYSLECFFLAFCMLRLNLLDLNDNAPGKIEKLNGMLTRLNFFSVCYDILELYNLSFSSWK